MEFRVLGPLEVRDADGPIALGGAKQRAVLAHLLLRAGTLVPAERLIDEVWDDAPPAAARNVLQSYVSRLRKALGPDRLEHTGGGYVLHVAPEEIDLQRFEALTTAARKAAASEPEQAAEVFRDAEALWRGAPLDDLADQASLRADVGHLEDLRLAAIEERVVTELTLGRHADLVPELEALTAHYPLREGLWAHLMTALYRSGRQADALAAYHRARERLVEELGIEPSADLRRLQEQMLRQDPSLEVTGRPLRGFRLLERVGEGSFGVVHRALQPQVGREVAIKVIRPALADDPQFIRRFQAEAQLVARLEHPYVVPLYDYWREPGGAYLVMRYLRGGTLRDVLADGPLPAERAQAIAGQVGAALAAAHRHGIVHRDVKPGNILLDEDGNAYLSDFGIARDVEDARTPPRVPEGTTSSADYMSPEEARGEEPTARADVYSLGLVLFEMLGGDVTPHLDRVVRRATTADPDERYPDAAALLAALAGEERDSGPTRNPYKGLRPFAEADAIDFHGRAALVARLRERLADTRLLALVGPSGSGKSSVVHAGLIPALREAGWFVATMHPGADPAAELAAALEAIAPVPPGADLLLVVDQFEELFTRAPEDARAAFMDELLAMSPAKVVLTLRADMLGGPLSRPGFAEVLRAGTELVLPLSAGELEQAIAGPAARAGLAVEPALVGTLVADVIGQPGGLPLLQFALAELVDHGSGLTAAAYAQLGGVAGAVARGAEAVYARLGDAGRAATQQLFLRLVEPGGARRRAARSELLAVVAEPAAMADAIDGFAARRLLSFDRDPETREPTVEIAHDALLVAWERLREWVLLAEDDLRTQRQLGAAAGEWQSAGRDPSFLLRGARLERLSAWSTETALALTPDEREFLAASRAEADAQRARERAIERRSLRRLQALVAVLAGAALVAGALTLFAFDQRSDAEEQRRTAEARGLAAASVASLDEDAERSVLLALEAARTGDTALPEAEEALHRAVIASRLRLRVPGLGGALDWSPDGELFVTEGQEETGRIDVRDAATGKSLRVFEGHEVDVNMAVFDGTGEQMASAGDDGSLAVWDPRTGEELQRFEGEGPVWGAAFSPDGSQVAAAWWAAGAVRIFDTRTGRQVAAARNVAASFNTAFSADGRRLAIASFDGGAVVVDARSGRRVGTTEHGGGTADVDWSPDGRRLATSGFDGVIQVMDARSLRPRATLKGHESEIVAADWSHDSRRLVSGSRDGTARVWSASGEEVLAIHAQERGGGLWVAFAPDGRRIMTGDEGITAVKVWDVRAPGGAEWANLPVAPTNFAGTAFTPDGAAVATARPGGGVALWDARRGKLTAALRGGPGDPPPSGVDIGPDGHVAATAGDVARIWGPDGGRPKVLDAPGATDAVWSPDGAHLAVGSFDGTVRVFAQDGTRAAVLTSDAPARATSLDFSPDGQQLAVAMIPEGPGAPEETPIWDWRRGEVVRTLRATSITVGFSPDGHRVAAAPPSGPAAIFDVRTGKRLAQLSGHGGGITQIAFAPDGRRVATSSADATVRLWDARSGRQALVLRGHETGVTDLAFSPDGSQLVSTGTDGVARVWALDLGELVAIARRSVTRRLTDAECRQYLERACR